MIECIEELGAPLQGQAFANPAEIDGPAENEIEVFEGRAGDVVTACVAEGPKRLLPHSLRVKPLRNGSRSPVDVSHDVRPAEVVERVGLVARNERRERPSALKR